MSFSSSPAKLSSAASPMVVRTISLTAALRLVPLESGVLSNQTAPNLPLSRPATEELLSSHRRLWRRSFSPSFVLDRLARGTRQLSPGGLLLSATMNGFYGLKQLTDNLPATASLAAEGRIEHPTAEAKPVRLTALTSRRGAVKRAFATG